MARIIDNGTTVLRHVVRHPVTDITMFGRRDGGNMVVVGVRFGEIASIPGMRCVDSMDPGLVHLGRVLWKVLDGRPVELSAIPIDMAACSDFRKKVVCAARSIPRGKTVSYAELAGMAGRPHAVRAAASVMRHNRFPLIVPCHRVIKSDGTIGGFMGKREGKEVGLKSRLLELERTG